MMLASSCSSALSFLPPPSACLYVVVPRADGELGVAGNGREKGAGSGGYGYGGTARQLRALDGKALREDHHQHGACIYRIHHGRVHGEKAGAARHAGGMRGAAAKLVRKILNASHWRTPHSAFQ